MDRRRRRRAAAACTRQVSSTPSWRVKRVLSPSIAASSRTSYGVGPSPPCSANSRSRVTCSGRRRAGALGLDQQPDAGRGVEPDDELTRLRRARPSAVEAEPRRSPEDQPQLGLGDRQALAGADEERHALPAPVVDLQAQRRVGLGRRVRRDSLDVTVAVVLPAHVVRGVGRRASAANTAYSASLRRVAGSTGAPSRPPRRPASGG